MYSNSESRRNSIRHFLILAFPPYIIRNRLEIMTQRSLTAWYRSCESTVTLWLPIAAFGIKRIVFCYPPGSLVSRPGPFLITDTNSKKIRSASRCNLLFMRVRGLDERMTAEKPRLRCIREHPALIPGFSKLNDYKSRHQLDSYS
jgi:hypothetical protein